MIEKVFRLLLILAVVQFGAWPAAAFVSVGASASQESSANCESIGGDCCAGQRDDRPCALDDVCAVACGSIQLLAFSVAPAAPDLPRLGLAVSADVDGLAGASIPPPLPPPRLSILA